MKKANKNLENKLKEILKQISRFEIVLPGTVRQLFMKCGKSGCACQKDKSARHGPYYLWDRKVGSKLSSKMVSKSQLTKIKIGIESRRKIERLLSEAIAVSQMIVSEEIDSERKGGK